MSPAIPAAVVAPASLVQVRSTFQFTIDAPLARAAPLFGPEGERVWAGNAWDPHFLHPDPPRDVEGAVFTVQHGAVESLWINTLFDVAGGRMQYVVVVPGAMTSVIDVRLAAEGERTLAKVTYTRTALTAGANAHVQALSARDAGSGPDWQAAIATALGRTSGGR